MMGHLFILERFIYKVFRPVCFVFQVIDCMFNVYQGFGFMVNLADAVVNNRRVSNKFLNRIFVKLPGGRRGDRILYYSLKYFVL